MNEIKVYVMSIGYAEMSSRLNSLINGQPETVVVGETECGKAKFVHADNQFAYFRCGRKFYRQLIVSLAEPTTRYAFDDSDIVEWRNAIELPTDWRKCCVYNPPQWLANGLQQTATGYGSKLNSGWSIWFNGKLRRLYVTCFSNSGTTWFMVGDRRIVVS